MRLFLDSIGFSDLSAKKIKKWMPEDRRQFEIIQERYYFKSYICIYGTFTKLFLNYFVMDFLVT